MQDIREPTQSYKIYSATAPDLEPIPQTLVDARVIERRLPEQCVDLVVRLTEPRTSGGRHRRRSPRSSTQCQRWQWVQQLQHVRALWGALPPGVIGGSRVKECPGGASQGLRVGRAVCTCVVVVVRRNSSCGSWRR